MKCVVTDGYGSTETGGLAGNSEVHQGTDLQVWKRRDGGIREREREREGEGGEEEERRRRRTSSY
jgi:hypothetical protein